MVQSRKIWAGIVAHSSKAVIIAYMISTAILLYLYFNTLNSWNSASSDLYRLNEKFANLDWLAYISPFFVVLWVIIQKGKNQSRKDFQLPQSWLTLFSAIAFFSFVLAVGTFYFQDKVDLMTDPATHAIMQLNDGHWLPITSKELMSAVQGNIRWELAHHLFGTAIIAGSLIGIIHGPIPKAQEIRTV
jgi:hypothetical protein